LIDQLRTTPDTAMLAVEPIVVRRRGKRPVIVRVLPIDGAARNPFAEARALLLLSDLEGRSVADPNLISKVFALTPAEAKLTALIATGMSPREAADELNITLETVRTQLKSVFAKTDTHRQSEIVALLARLSRTG